MGALDQNQSYISSWILPSRVTRIDTQGSYEASVSKKWCSTDSPLRFLRQEKDPACNAM